MKRALLICGFIGVMAVAPALADAISPDGTWHEFFFGLAGTFATGCGSEFCSPTVDPVAEMVTNPPWTFDGPATVTITDLFSRGDQFELFDNGVAVGPTSVPIDDGAGTCGNDIGL